MDKVDFGGRNDGLLHTSKLGPVPLHNLLIGQSVGVDILAVEDGRVTLGLFGLDQQPDKTEPSREPAKRRLRGKDATANNGANRGQTASVTTGSIKRSIATKVPLKGSGRLQTATDARPAEAKRKRLLPTDSIGGSTQRKRKKKYE